MMFGVHRDAVGVAAGLDAALFFALLGAVVTQLAQRLMIVRVPEQFFVAAMRDLVIDYCGRHDHAAFLVIGTQGMFSQERYTIVAPAPVVTACG